MKARTAKRGSAKGSITSYISAQKPALAAVCRVLRKEIKLALPKATAKIYHSTPVWFIGENAVVGFSVTAKKKVTLLFWNGKAFKDPDLKAVGKFKAAQVQFGDAKEIDKKKLKKWLKKAKIDIWDFAGMRKRVVAKR